VTVRGGAPSTPPNGPPPSAIQSSPSLVAFDPKLAVPSQPIYFQRNDFIAFNFNTNATNIIVRINYRWLTPDGEIKEGEFDTAPFTTTNFISFPLYEGWLLSFAARVTTGPALGQWCFMQAFITRSVAVGAQSPIYALFWSGFVYQFTANGWPGLGAKEISDGPGVIRTIAGTFPAVGSELQETVPSGRRWTLLALQITLLTSATVANRFPGFQLDDGSSPYFYCQTNVAQPAGQNFTYQISPGGPFYNNAAFGFILPFPNLLPLKVGYHIRTVTQNLQAGDQYSQPHYQVLEWGQWDS
jgi:hypothetical protein